MDAISDSTSLTSKQALWDEAVNAAVRTPGSAVQCPQCGAISLTASWHLCKAASREGVADVICATCKETKQLKITLPVDALPFFPSSRLGPMIEAISAEIESVTSRMRDLVSKESIAQLTVNPLWNKARWKGMTYRWHEEGRFPPLMGLCFDDGECAKELFGSYKRFKQEDPFEEIRVSIIEGDIPGQQQGYSVHISPEADTLAMHATAADVVLQPKVIPLLGQWTRV